MNSLNEHLHPIHRKLKHFLCGLGPWTLDLGPWTLDPGPSTLDIGHWTLDSPAIRTSSICMKKIPNINNRGIVTSHSAIENPIDTIQISQQIKMIFG